MYSTNPSLFGGGAIVLSGWLAGRPGATSSVASWSLLVFGYLCYALALPTTAGVGLPGTVRVCAVIGGLASAIGAGLAWSGPFVVLKWTCVVGGGVVFASGWITAAVLERRRPPPSEPGP